MYAFKPLRPADTSPKTGEEYEGCHTFVRFSLRQGENIGFIILLQLFDLIL